MIALYIIIFISLILFILSKIPYNKPAPKKNFITPERQAYFDAVALKMEEPPEIIYGVDPLQNERIKNKGIGRFQTALMQQKLYIPEDADNFFYCIEMSGYQLGVTVSWALQFLQSRLENNKFERNKNGASIIIEQIYNGLRTMNYDLLEAAGKIKYDNRYKKANNIMLNEKLYSINFLGFREILQLLKNESIVVKNVTTGMFENNISYCETKEYHGPLAGGDYFQLFIGDVLIYKVQTLYH